VTNTGETEETYIVKMLDELRAIREKYGLPKGILFVPDRIESSIKRNSYDNLHLSYKEYFDYLPDMVLDLVIPLTINMLVQTGLPRERIERFAKNGVSVELDGNADSILGTLLSEILIQKRFNEEDIAKIVRIITRTRKALVDTSELEFEWNEEIGARYFDLLAQMGRVIQNNPSMLSEMEEVRKKYSDSIEKVRESLNKKDKEPDTKNGS
jgi:hypothetical protein